MILYFLLHLFLSLAFGAVLVVNCGKKKNKKINEAEIKKSVQKNLILPNLMKEAEKRKREEEEKQKMEEEQRQERDKDHKERLGKDSDKTKEVWKNCTDCMETCNYFDQYSDCDLAYRVRMAYNRIRDHCHKLAIMDSKTNIKYWCLYEHDIGTRIYLPYFREFKTKFQEKHREHLDQKGIDEVLHVFKQIEKDFELVVEAKKKYEKEDNGEEISEKFYENRKFENPEPWMKPSWYDEFNDAIQSRNRECLKPKSAWKGREDIDEIINTCHKDIHGGECDFIGRANFYIGQWRKHAQDDPKFPHKGMTYMDADKEPATYRAANDDKLKYDIELSDIYMKKVDEAKEKHRDHLKNPKELDDWFQLHKNKTKELKKRYEAYEKEQKEKIYRNVDWIEEHHKDRGHSEWMELIGYKDSLPLPVVIPLSEDKEGPRDVY